MTPDTSSAGSGPASGSGGTRRSSAYQRRTDRRSVWAAFVATTSIHGSADPSTNRNARRRRHAVTNVACVTSSANIHDPVSRNAWLYTARECRSKN
jgi:phosphoribulokinase